MEVDFPSSKKFEIIEIETEAQTEDPSEQKVKIVLKAFQREIVLNNLKHQVKDSLVTVFDRQTGERLNDAVTSVEPDPIHSGRSLIRVKEGRISEQSIF